MFQDRQNTLLIVEEDKPTQWMYGSDISSFNTKVIPAMNEDEAIDAVEKFWDSIDMIIVNSSLKWKETVWLVERIKNRFKWLIVSTVDDYSKSKK